MSSPVSSHSTKASRAITDHVFWTDVLRPRSGHCLRNPLAVLLPILEGYAADAADQRTAAVARRREAEEEEKKGGANGEGGLSPAADRDPLLSSGSGSGGRRPGAAADGNDGALNEPFSDGCPDMGSSVSGSKMIGTDHKQQEQQGGRKGGSSSSGSGTNTQDRGAAQRAANRREKEGGGGEEDDVPLVIPHMPFDDSLSSPLTLSLIQHVMLFAAPMDQLRYVVPCMSSSWSSTAVVEKGSNRVVTHGSIPPPAVSGRTLYKSVTCGDSFIALLTANNEVQVAGQLETPPAQISSGPDPQILRTMTSNKIKMLSGQGTKLLALTTAHTVRPLSVVPANTKTLIPYRLCKFIEAGLGDDCYMVGFDNVLYKTTASQRALGTPRRVMTMSKVGVSRVAAGAGFMIVIDLSGHLYTMGKNKRGQLGNGRKQDSMRKPYLHTHLQHHYFISAAAGESHSIVLASNGYAYAAGANEHGQLGLGQDVAEALVFTRVPLPSRCTSIAAGPSASMFACADGKVYVCGFNEMGMLGVEGVSRADKIVFRPLPMAGITNGVAEMVLDNFSLAVGAVRSGSFVGGGGGPSAASAALGVSGQRSVLGLASSSSSSNLGGRGGGGGGAGGGGGGAAGGPAVEGGLGGDRLGTFGAGSVDHDGTFVDDGQDKDGLLKGSSYGGRRDQKTHGGCCCVTM